MKNIKLLDCTLRDGGYINNWEFGKKTIEKIIKELCWAKVDYIEIGFLRDVKYNENITLFNNLAEVKNVLPHKIGESQIVLQVLHNLYDINKLEKNDGSIGMIRVTFHDYDIDEGLEFCRGIMNKGYRCFCNPINIMGYSDSEIIELVEKVNRMKPHGFAIVDTFGSMHVNDLLRIYLLIENHLDSSICIGIHLHENLSLAYALAQKFIEIRNTKRNCIIDASLLGMGRVPGNLCLELIANYLNEKFEQSYNLNEILEIIDNYIIGIKRKHSWGYAPEYALSAKYNLHRNYSEYLMDKGKLRIKDINFILSMIENNKKTTFDSKYIEQLYDDYQDVNIDDRKYKNDLKKELQQDEILVLAPGSSLDSEYEQIEAFIKERNVKIISLNFIPTRFQTQYAFFSNIKHFETYKDNEQVTFLCSSNVTRENNEPVNAFNYYSLLCHHEKNDNCAIMLLNLLIKAGIKNVYIAGMDGYKENENNYTKETGNRNSNKGAKENEKIKKQLNEVSDNLSIKFITTTVFNEEL